MTLKEATHIHVLGAGGIGVSAIARMQKAQGKLVTGYDSASSEVTKELERCGIPVDVAPAPTLPSGTDLVLYSVAVKQVHPEFFAHLVRDGVPAMSYPESLSEVSAMKRTIAVSGTHGKTTTTAMVARVLSDAGLDPTSWEACFCPSGPTSLQARVSIWWSKPMNTSVHS
jgi:UDP-N-acetylmuramate--alanine ligase